jgi:hypothetical protein
MSRVLALSLALGMLACRPGTPIVNTDPMKATTPGTIAGSARSAGGDPISGRRVEAVDTKTGQRYAAETGVTGGYSIKVPPGHYRLELQLGEGETVVQEPGTIDINSGDLDPNMDIVVRVAR